jgi:predicted Zn-dependent protease
MKYAVAILILLVLCMNIPLDSFAETGKHGVYNTLKLRFDTNPNVCLFEVNPEIYDDWHTLKYVTISAIEEWVDKLEYVYPDGDWSMDIKTISWEEHVTKTVHHYTECNIMINYEETSNSHALGTTSLFFNQSWHKFMFINVFLESQKSVTKIVLRNDINEATVEKIEQSYPLPINTIRNIVLHEFGHGLGLGHYDSPEPLHAYLQSSMTPSISPFDETQNLSVTYLDLAMIGLIYGENGWKLPSPVYHINGCYIIDMYQFKCF